MTADLPGTLTSGAIVQACTVTSILRVPGATAASLRVPGATAASMREECMQAELDPLSLKLCQELETVVVFHAISIFAYCSLLAATGMGGRA